MQRRHLLAALAASPFAIAAHAQGSDQPIRWIVIPVGMLIGYYIVKAEPAVYVLMKQVEELTSGAVSGKMLQRSLSFGVSASVGLALLQSRIRFVFCLQYPDGYYSSRIDSESAFLETVGKMLHGREEAELESLQELERSFVPQTAICFFGGPETPFDLPVQKILSYRCSENGDVTPENYRDALRILAL